MSVDPFATLGFTLIKRLATWPPSKTQSTVSPAMTLATFSSAGRTINVDLRSPARITGGVCDSDTVTVRGALGWSGCPGPAACRDAETSARWRATAMGIGGFMGLSFVKLLLRLTLGKACDALGESVLGDKAGAAHPILRFGGECRIAAAVEIQAYNLGESVATHIKCLAIPQALEESELLFVHLEQLGVASPVERRIAQKKERSAGIHDAVGVRPEVFSRLADHGDAAKILPNRLDGSQRCLK